ncbi:MULTISPECIES: S41 family peptidase [Porphyromonadaceae]|uniref:Peptidase S41 n=1 Tax=Sanguibacteroides justesenii TaxID=1547597 RepID=A0A0C3RDR8_9PORP|nr:MULTISPECIES: S41 family peptidase [Porphyromonadaceae]KIO44456.1 peptidase S41 [Sanguibacteroides justesenii]
MNRENLRAVLTPIVLALAVVFGMMINHFIPTKRNNAAASKIFLPVNGSKLDVIINMIQHSYVDTVNSNELVEKAISILLKDLDPHTVYIPAEDMQRANESIVGNFGGIGVQFYNYLDTALVVKVVPGGPSEKAGVQDGDRIIRVNDSLIAGKNMDSKQIMSMLRGEMGTDVKLTILRKGEPQLLIKNVTRGSIPIKSIDIAYMLNDTTGYVKIRTFGMHTYGEFMRALAELTQKGMKKVVVDLRDNEGGVLPIAIQMINEFLEEGQLILYTQGQASPRSDFNANGKGNYKDLKLDVLINEFSASASEIFAGAIQDNDRGTIIGRRSFGKGLVQEQRMLPDGSALRLTVARYYIPSGRSIQKPYNEGKEKYYNDIYNRLKHGEFSQKDSIVFDEKLKFQTVGGRTVYGGGGVMPDIFVPADTTGASRYLVALSESQLLYDYTFDFMEHHRAEMKDLKDYKSIQKYLKRFDLVGDMADYAAKRGLKKDKRGIKDSYEILRVRLEAFIARHLIDDEGFYPILGEKDITIQKAIEE